MLFKNLIVMKNTAFLFLIFTILLSSCKKEDFKYQSAFDKSLKAWEDYKSDINNTYTYTSYSGSVFGYASQTRITVINGEVAGREYKLYKNNGSTQQEVVTSWTEDKATLNTHDGGAEALTIDQLYTKAKTEWLTADAKANNITFETNGDGIIASCGYTPKNCVDDCFRGVHITTISAITIIN